MHHIKAVSRPRLALNIGGTTLDPVLLKQFLISVLTAVNGLMGRKHPITT